MLSPKSKVETKGNEKKDTIKRKKGRKRGRRESERKERKVGRKEEEMKHHHPHICFKEYLLSSQSNNSLLRQSILNPFTAKLKLPTYKLFSGKKITRRFVIDVGKITNFLSIHKEIKQQETKVTGLCNSPAPSGANNVLSKKDHNLPYFSHSRKNKYVLLSNLTAGLHILQFCFLILLSQ